MGTRDSAPTTPLLSRLEQVLRGQQLVLFSSGASSYLAIGVAGEILVREDDAVVVSGKRFGELTLPTRDPFVTIGDLIGRHPHCRLFGYIAYDACRFYAPYTKRATHPVIHLIEPKVVVSTSAVDDVGSISFAEGAEDLASAVLAALGGSASPVSADVPTSVLPIGSEDANDRQRYTENVERAIERLHGTDLLKVILSRSVETPGHVDLFRTHATATAEVAFDRSFAFRLGTVEGVGVSPAPLLRTSSSGNIETVALAGSRPRGATPEDDERLRSELYSDPKEASEHALSAWMAHREIASVSRPGSAAIREFMDVRRFTHIQHLAAHVTGELAAGLHTGHALRAVFPGVTATGLPKDRAIETIDRLEASSRGVYGGAVGWWSGSGDADFSICIRSVFGYDGRIRISAGAGIVGSSNADYEWTETVNKMNTILKRTILANDGG